jgi:cytochrome c oxidase subunit 3
MSTTEDDSTDGHSHHLPAVEDWPQGFGEASWWPFVTALGTAGIYVGAGLFVLSQGDNALVGASVGPATIIAGVVLFLVGLYGWVYHGFVKHYWSRDAEDSTGKLRWGMLLFLGTEVATFGAGFVYYFFIRVGPWPPGELPNLLSSLVLANTAILILSSVTLHFAHSALRNGNRRRFAGLLGTTLLLGVVFLAGQVLEYYEFIVGEGFTLSSGIYFSAFFGLTGLHGLHVTLGVILLALLSVRTLYGHYSPERHTSVSTVTMYWHFVDAVWIFLVVTLYVGAAFTL